MAKVYSLAKELEALLPVADYTDWKKHMEKEEAFVEKVKEWAKKRNPKDKYAGEEYDIGMGDGCARYIILSTTGSVQLMHLPIGDAWDSPWADRVLKKDIVAECNRKVKR